MEHDGPNTGAYTQTRKNAADQFANHHKPFETTNPEKVHPEKYNETYPRLNEELTKKRSTARVTREKQEGGRKNKNKNKLLRERRPASETRRVTKRHDRKRCNCRKCREAKKRRRHAAIMCFRCCCLRY